MNKIAIIIEYLNITKKLMKYSINSDVNKILDTILLNILKIYNVECLKEQISNLINKANLILTTGDVLALSMQQYQSSEERMVIEYKASLIHEEKINELREFNCEEFILELKNNAFIGNKDALKLYSILKYEGLLLEKNIDEALNTYKMLMYSGDLLSTKSLAYINEKDKQNNKYKFYNEIYNILSNDSIIKINNKMNKEIKETIYIVELIKNRQINKKTNNLEIYLLNYLVVTNDNFISKVNNLLDMSKDGYYLSIQESLVKKKKFNF